MRIRAGALALSLLIAACGGSTSNGTGTGGASGGGGTSSGGTSSGGTSSGGTSSGGTSAGGGGGSGGVGNASGLTACNAPGTCALFANNCCGGYCDPNAPLSGFQAVNAAKVNDLEAQICTSDIACPGCVSMDNPAYLALCRAGQCAAIDLRKDALSACKSHDDCRLRWGSNCCESCGGGVEQQLIAYNKNANLEAEVCQPNGGACPPCVPPPYPSYLLPICGADAHCSWTVIGP